MTLFEALKYVVRGTLMFFLADECSSKTHSRKERRRENWAEHKQKGYQTHIYTNRIRINRIKINKV
jgi:hypothetical protein